MTADRDDQNAEFDRLARRYLDLWSGQLGGLAGDRALTDQIARLLAVANAQVASLMPSAPPPAAGASHDPAAASRTSPTSPASGDGAVGLDELRSRLAALEARVRALEGGRGG